MCTSSILGRSHATGVRAGHLDVLRLIERAEQRREPRGYKELAWRCRGRTYGGRAGIKEREGLDYAWFGWKSLRPKRHAMRSRLPLRAKISGESRGEMATKRPNMATRLMRSRAAE